MPCNFPGNMQDTDSVDASCDEVNVDLSDTEGQAFRLHPIHVHQECYVCYETAGQVVTTMAS